MRKTALRLSVGLLVVGLLTLLFKYQHLRYQKTEIFSLFQIFETALDRKTCGIPVNDDYVFGFNPKYTHSLFFYHIVKLKGIYIGVKDNSGEKQLIVKVPGLLFPKYYYLDASTWPIDLDYINTSKQEGDFGEGSVEAVLPYLKVGCPLIFDVVLYNRGSVSCDSLPKGQVQCEQMVSAFGKNPDSDILDNIYYDNNQSKTTVFWNSVKYFFRSRLYFGPVIGISV